MTVYAPIPVPEFPPKGSPEAYEEGAFARHVGIRSLRFMIKKYNKSPRKLTFRDYVSRYNKPAAVRINQYAEWPDNPKAP